MSSPLAWFGLPDEADERAIKRAYAQRLKATRPDTDPVGFQTLHDMYRNALEWAQRQATRPSMAPEPYLDDAPAATTQEAEVSGMAAAVRISEAHAEEAEPPAMPRPAAVPPTLPPQAVPHAPRPAPPPTHPLPSQAPRPPVPVPLPPRTPAFSASQAATSHFDMDVFMADYLEIAIHRDAQGVQDWLQQRQELWSLRLKQEAGRAILQRLFRDPPPIRMSNLEATLAFFGMDHALTGIDPLQLMQLREAMQQRHARVQNVHPPVMPWGANRRHLDLAAFFQWFCELADQGEDERLAATLSVQPALLSLSVRQQVAPRLLERLLREHPPMPQDCSSLLLSFFGLVPLLTQAGQPPGEVVAALHMRWLMEPRHNGKLTLQVKEPSERYGDPAKAARRLRWLRRPFQWWWLALAALVPKLLASLGLFAWRLSGGVPARLDGHFDPRLTRFCIATADRSRVSWPRVFVGAVRCAMLLAACALLNVLTLRGNVFPNTGDTWLPLMAGGLVTAGWLYYMGFTAVRLWQQRPEEPVQPRPLLRLGMIPLLVAGGLVLSFVADQLVASQAVLITTAGLAYTRYRQRNPSPKKGSPAVNLLVLVYVTGMAAWLVLRYPAVTASIAMFYWVLDLLSQRKQLRLRYRRPVDPPPSPAGAR
ncbi:hypothetical protein [Dyella sp. C9]|uniref:hypothetical protein n=1 Tax=Dyella sp. C9 TaxID=2202154 RepID=UPI0018E504D0|nr:hypothetical protein [Dyella sp. C9]